MSQKIQRFDFDANSAITGVSFIDVPTGGTGGNTGTISAGTASATLGNVVFSNSNGVSFGINGQTVTATVQTNYLTTAALSNHSHGNPQLNLTNLSGTTASNSAGFTLSLSAGNYLTTARASNDAVGLNSALTAGPLAVTVNSSGLSINAGSAAGTTTGFSGNSVSGSMTLNTAGLALSLNHPAWLTTAAQSNHSHGNPQLNLTNLSGTTASNSAGFTLSLSAGNYLTTARASTDAIGLNTAGSNVTWTANSSGLSLDARGYAGTGTSATNASITLNSNGLAISVAAGGPGGGGVAIGAGTATATSGTVVFSNSNNISFGLNGQTITANYSNPVESMFWRPNDQITTVGAPINASASVVYCPIDHNLSASRFDLIASITVGTALNNSSAAFLYSITAALYTLNGGTLSSVSSITTANQMTWNSNTTGSVTGMFFLSAPLTVNAVADKYWVGVQLSTRATGHTGALTTSLGNTVSMMGVGSAVAGAYSVREPGANTANSNGWFYGMGMYSGTTNYATIALSNLTQQGTNANRANVAMRFLNV